MRKESNNWIKNYIGLPYRDKGRDERGYDCWGLVILVHREIFGIKLPSYTDRYKDTKDSESLGLLVKKEREAWNHIEKGLEKKGDVIVLRMRGQPMHIGVVVEKGLFCTLKRE